MVRPHSPWLGSAIGVVAALLLAACTSPSGSVAPSLVAPTSAPEGSAPAQRDVAIDLGPGIEAWRGQRDTRKNIRAILVSVGGRMVFEKYYGTTPDVARDMESVTKSVIATLVGAAIAEGDLASVDQSLADLLPAYAGTMSPAAASVTLRQLLTMTAGVPDWTEQTSPSAAHASDWVAAILATITPTADAKFVYSNPDAHLVAAVLTQATGRSVLDFARAVLFTPLGIDSSSAISPLAAPSNAAEYMAAKFAWPVDPQNVNLGYSLLTLRPRDMLKIGELYLNDGRYNGQQILPPGWVSDASSPHVKTYDTWDSYGYLWWVTTADGAPAYAAVGAGGQLIEVIPSRKTVVVATSEYDALSPSLTSEEPYDLTSMVNTVLAPALTQ